MRLGQDIDLAGNRANRAIIAPVNARLARQNATADNALLKALKNILDVVFRRAFLGRQQGHDFVFNLSNALIALGLFRDAIRITQRARSRRLDRGYQFRIGRRRLPIPARFTCFANQFVDGVDHGLHFLMRIQHRTQHLVFRQFFGF